MRTSLLIAAAGLLAVAVWQWQSGDPATSPPDETTAPVKSADGSDSSPAAASHPHPHAEVSPVSAKPPIAPPIAKTLDGLVPPIQLGSDVAVHLAGLTPVLHASEVEAFLHDERAHFHPHGEKVCASGCAASNHPTATLTAEVFRNLMQQFAADEISENSLAFESLLYYGRQTKQFLARQGPAPLDSEHAQALRRELERSYARISIRVVEVDAAGKVVAIRSSLPPTLVPLDRRHEFDMDVHGVQPLITSGTVKRVGLYHLWTRL